VTFYKLLIRTVRHWRRHALAADSEDLYISEKLVCLYLDKKCTMKSRHGYYPKLIQSINPDRREVIKWEPTRRSSNRAIRLSNMHVVQHARSQKYVVFLYSWHKFFKDGSSEMVCFFSLHQARNLDDVSSSRSIRNERLGKSFCNVRVDRSLQPGSPFSIRPGRRVSSGTD
jgi:hypothetical protein